MRTGAGDADEGDLGARSLGQNAPRNGMYPAQPFFPGPTPGMAMYQQMPTPVYIPQMAAQYHPSQFVGNGFYPAGNNLLHAAHTLQGFMPTQVHQHFSQQQQQQAAAQAHAQQQQQRQHQQQQQHQQLSSDSQLPSSQRSMFTAQRSVPQPAPSRHASLQHHQQQQQQQHQQHRQQERAGRGFAPSQRGQQYADNDDSEGVDDEVEAEDDDDDEDFGVRRKSHGTGRRTVRLPRHNVHPPAPVARSHHKKRVVDDSDDEEEEEDADYALAQQIQAQEMAGHGSRPRRAAARAAVDNMKNNYLEDEDEEDLGGRNDDSSMSPVRGGGDPYAVARSSALGLRVRPQKPPPMPRAPVETYRPRPKPRRKKDDYDSDGDKRRGGNKRGARVSYAEDDDGDGSGDSDEEKKNKMAAKREAVAAFMGEEDGEMDDEVERVLAHRDMEDADADPTDKWASREFLVKWKRWSYIHCSWDTRATLSQLGGYKRLLNYMKRVDEREVVRVRLSREEKELQDVEQQMEEELVQEHQLVERVVATRPDPDGSTRFLVKWKGLPYVECTWEQQKDVMRANGEAAIEDYRLRESRLSRTTLSVEQARNAFHNMGMRALEKQPDYLTAGKLRDYQLEGLNWLVYSWYTNKNCILADEMGLGKTVQCVSMIGYLSEQLKMSGPFLVIVPLSTVPNWIKEFRKWLPQCNALVYVGDSRSREVCREFELYTNRSGRQYKFDVLITTYELVLKDAATLGRINWSYMMVDEAHRLKNNESSLYQELVHWRFANKLLVTGTPLQNSMKELWCLLHFLEPSKFPDCADFEKRYSLQNADEVTTLHTELRPHLLRRVIRDVEKSLPPKNERILRVEMSPLQKQYYKWILTRNYRELNKGTKTGGQVSLLNIITELKKCCNHPFLFESAEADFRGSEGDRGAVDRLVVTSGKMVLLDKLLRRLKETGHRVLIFSQMVRMLDIISDYMRLRGFQHQRLDGSTPAPVRHQAMEHFNAPDSRDFAFLLSTRAGGLGINLATADTVIIFDSDWNPQNDLQAMSRAHRIGQTETVNIYRFLTSQTVEVDILERAKRKMVLDHLVIQRMDTSGRMVLDKHGDGKANKAMFGKEELAAILRFGAEQLFNEDEATKKKKEQDLVEEDIDAILARAEVVDTKVEDVNPGGELLNSFNVATFKTEEDDAAFWNRLIPTTERPAREDEPEALGIRAARLRNVEEAVVRHPSADDESGDSGHGGDFEAGPGGKARKPRGGRREGGLAGAKGQKRGTGEKYGPGVALPGALLRIDVWPPEVDASGAEKPSPPDWPPTLSKRDANFFVKAVKKFGLLTRLEEICAEISPTFEQHPEPARRALWHGLVRACEMVEREHAARPQTDGEKDRDAILDWFGVAVRANEVADHVRRMALLARKIEAVQDPERQFRPDGLNVPLPKWGRACGWTPKDDAMLLLGVYWYGLGRWDLVGDDIRLGLTDKVALAAAEKRGKEFVESIDPTIELPKGSHLETRVMGLLKKLQAVAAAAHMPVKQKRMGPGMAGRGIPARRRPPSGGPGRADGASPPGRSAHDDCEAMLGPEVMVFVKKLRLLQRKGAEISREKTVDKTRKYVVSIGEAITSIVRGHYGNNPARAQSLEQTLWDYVAQYSENKMPGPKLKSVYLRLKGPPGGGAPAGPGKGGGGGGWGRGGSANGAMCAVDDAEHAELDEGEHHVSHVAHVGAKRGGPDMTDGGSVPKRPRHDAERDSHRASYHGGGHHERERPSGPAERHRPDNYHMYSYDADGQGEADGYDDEGGGYEHHEHHAERHVHRPWDREREGGGKREHYEQQHHGGGGRSGHSGHQHEGYR